MNPRLLTFALAGSLLTLAGCASQIRETDPAETSGQRLSTLESRVNADSNSTLALLGDLGRKVNLLATDLQRLRESSGEQARADAAARQALAERLAQTEKQQQATASDTREMAAQLGELRGVVAGLRDQARESRQQIDRLAARLDHHQAEQTQALEAETTELEARLDDADEQLDELAARLAEGQARIETLAAGLNDTDASHRQRLDTLATRLDAATAAQATLQGALNAADTRDAQRPDSLAAQAKSASEQAAAAQAGLPALREQVAAAGSRLGDHDARLAALNQRLDEIARMAQEAYDATGLGQRKIFGKVVEAITLTEDRTLFPINSPDLGEQDKAKLDALVLRLKALGTYYHLQIQGHTEGFGADDYNYALGRARAEVVKNYLKEKGGIPLLRMSVMSYGSLEAAGAVGRNNRRIVVQVLQ